MRAIQQLRLTSGVSRLSKAGAASRERTSSKHFSGSGSQMSCKIADISILCYRYNIGNKLIWPARDFDATCDLDLQLTHAASDENSPCQIRFDAEAAELRRHFFTGLIPTDNQRDLKIHEMATWKDIMFSTSLVQSLISLDTQNLIDTTYVSCPFLELLVWGPSGEARRP